MHRRFSILTLLPVIMISTLVQAVAAQTGCEGTSGSATINGSPWSTMCVVGATSTSCIDSLGMEYRCFQIVGSDSTSAYQTIAIFLAQEPVQGQTYSLGGGSGHGAMVGGQSSLWVTGDAPYTGQVQVTLYDTAHSTIVCNFSFRAKSLFPGQDVSVTNGNFQGRLVAVEGKTWSDVKTLFRVSVD